MARAVAPPAPGGKLTLVEAGRGLAAAAVVLFHANASARFLGLGTYPILSLGEHGVDFFFVLSGFIITFVHGSDVGRPERAGNYVRKRIFRIVPTLWLVVGLCVLALWAKGRTPDLATLGTSMLLYPSTLPTIPLVVWTLRHEALFYVAFAVLIVHRRLGLIALAAGLVAVCGQLALSLAGMPLQGVPAFLLSTFHLDFALGALVGLLHRRHAFRPGFAPLALGLAAAITVLGVYHVWDIGREGLLDYVSPAATLGTLVLGLAFTLLLHGLLCAEPLMRAPKALVALGGASYALYLVHTPINSVVQHAVAGLGTGWIQAALTIAGIVAGFALWRFYEQPVAQLLRRRARG